MSSSSSNKITRVLIASSHPLFGQGLRSLLQERRAGGVEVIGMVSTPQELYQSLQALSPDLIVVDYDDEKLRRDEVLAQFFEGEKQLRVVLLSLHTNREAIVYDRRTLVASQIDDWLQEWTTPAKSFNTDGESMRFPKRRRRASMKHLIIVSILVIAVTALLITGLEQARILPQQASAQAVTIDNMFHLQFKVIAFLFSLIVVMMVYSIVIFRRKKGDLTDGPHVEGNTRLEVAWTAAPLATVLFFAYLGGQSLAETIRSDPQAIEVNVIGSQWSWRFEYPEHGIVSTELVLPLKKQALLHLSSTDVIHSFWVPEFRVKQDALPGGKDFVRDLRITPSEIGEYKVLCAELCGVQHAYMVAPVRVVSAAEYDTWIIEQTRPSDDPVVRGQQVSQKYGCIACHSIDGSALVGPTWKGIYNHTVTLADGTTLTADENYLKESILNPGAKLVQGYANIMPANYADQLTDEQLSDLIEYMKSLK